jgi:hypothetical protein
MNPEHPMSIHAVQAGAPLVARNVGSARERASYPQMDNP